MSEGGRSVGIVSTARITHATPAAVYARTANRDWEEDTLVPEGCAQLDIAAQLVEQMNAGVIDVALGGGRQNFIPAGTMDAEGKEGDRGDGRNLAEEIVGDTGIYVQTQEEFDAIDTATIAGPVLGLFEPSHMLYEADRTGEPSLAEMTRAAIEVLARNEEGYYLMVEAGRVDHALHDGNLARSVRDGRAFAEAIALADELTDDADTLIVVTADHDHGLQFNGYCGRGSNILGLCMDVDPAGVANTGEPVLADDGKPYTVAGFMNGKGSILKPEQAAAEAMGQVGSGHAVAVYINADGSVLVDPADAEEATAAAGEPAWSGTRPVLTEEEATNIDYLQQALLPRSSETHSGTDVALYAKGPWAHLFDGTIEQNVIFHVMLHAATAGQ
jgi:alkaline phosphatase